MDGRRGKVLLLKVCVMSVYFLFPSAAFPNPWRNSSSIARMHSAVGLYETVTRGTEDRVR